MTKILTIYTILVAALAISSLASAQSASPSFDCSKASGEVEKLVCSDEGLAELDRKMADVYEKALERFPTEEIAALKAYQRGWIKGRNDCWKAEDTRDCVEQSYRTRITELQIQSGELMAPTAVGYFCEGVEGKPFFVAFYRETDPPSAVITYGNDQVIAFLAPSGSGAKYTTAGVELWEHHGEASVDWYGTKLQCKAR